MEISYNPPTDSFYGRFAGQGAAVASTVEVAPGVMVDRDAFGQMIGIEVQGVTLREAGTYGVNEIVRAPARRRSDAQQGDGDRGRLGALLEVRSRRTGSLQRSAQWLATFVPVALARRLNGGEGISDAHLMAWRERFMSGPAELSEGRSAYLATIRLSNRISRTGDLSDLELLHVLRGINGDAPAEAAR